jgi:hypothetical protein
MRDGEGKVLTADNMFYNTNHEAFSPDTPMESTSRFSIGVFHQESEIKTKIEIESNIKSKLRKPNDKDNNHGSDQNKALYFSTNIYSHNPPNKQTKKTADKQVCSCVNVTELQSPRTEMSGRRRCRSCIIRQDEAPVRSRRGPESQWRREVVEGESLCFICASETRRTKTSDRTELWGRVK